MLVWTKRGRVLLWTAFAVIFAAVLLAPLAMIALAAVAVSWNDVLPSTFTADHLASAVGGEGFSGALVSLQTALIASAVAVALGVAAAISVRSAPPWLRRLTDTVLHLPVAVPSVVIGLAMLVAFSQGPVLLNGTMWIVIAAHVVIVLPFAFSVVSAALDRLDPAFEQVAASLGAKRARVLWRIRLPLLLPSISASAGLALALSMGEVGATIMLYPPDWRTLPVTIFAQTDRGEVFLASASTVLLLVLTLLALLGLGSVRGRAVAR